MTAGRLPGAPQGKLPGQLSELEAAFPTLAHEGAEWNRLRCHLCQPVVTDGDGSTSALRACHDSHDKAHRASGQPAHCHSCFHDKAQRVFGQPAPLSPGHPIRTTRYAPAVRASPQQQKRLVVLLGKLKRGQTPFRHLSQKSADILQVFREKNIIMDMTQGLLRNNRRTICK